MRYRGQTSVLAAARVTSDITATLVAGRSMVKFEQASRYLSGIPYIRRGRARQLYDFVLTSGVSDILELGFAHGTSTCYMAAALQEKGGGTVLTMDLPYVRSLDPNLETLLQRMGLSRFVRPVYAPVSYTWELMKILQRSTLGGVCQPQFDFGFIDGSHNWETDGFAFFLVDKLLRTGGWLLFDDLSWRISDDPKLMGRPEVQAQPQEMRETPQVGRIFELLVSQHPSYTQVRVEEGLGPTWGWAQKTGSEPGSATTSAVHKRLRRARLKRAAALLAWRSAQRILRRR